MWSENEPRGLSFFLLWWVLVSLVLVLWVTTRGVASLLMRSPSAGSAPEPMLSCASCGRVRALATDTKHSLNLCREAGQGSEKKLGPEGHRAQSIIRTLHLLSTFECLIPSIHFGISLAFPP